jgi:hypothetical protein
VSRDWENHFTDALKRKLKQKFGDLLIATGYVRDAYW